MFSTIMKNPNLKVPDEMPKDPAFVGVSLTPHPSEGYEFHFVIPSDGGDGHRQGRGPDLPGPGRPGANQ